MPFFDKILQKIRKKYFYRYQNRNFNINILKTENRLLIQAIRAQPFGWVREQRDRSAARMLVDPFYSWTMIASE